MLKAFAIGNFFANAESYKDYENFIKAKSFDEVSELEVCEVYSHLAFEDLQKQVIEEYENLLSVVAKIIDIETK